MPNVDKGRVSDVPAPTHSFFVGRGPELDQISDLLSSGSSRLITLAGPGGIGKTRLATEAIRQFKDEVGRATVHWVRLARLSKDSDALAVERETASAVVKADFSGRSEWEALTDTLSQVDSADGGRVVLVLDNCEHVLTGVQAMVVELLEAVPELVVMTTSRGPIGLIDEHLIVVPPLARDQAVALFRQRAAQIGRPISGEHEEAIAADICRHVHHHPLYIQLAAARLPRQPLKLILADLTGQGENDRRMRWSVAGDQRHQRVRDVIEWSYDLCSAKEKLLFDRLSVFAAGYDANPEDGTANDPDVGADLEAITAVCCDDSGVDADEATLLADEIEELLDGLADQSLVTIHITTTSVRYSLLESLRLYAWERLRQRSSGGVDERSRLALRHLHYYRDKVANGATHWFSTAERDIVDWARAAWDNIFTAIETSLNTTGEASAGLEICLGLIELRIPFVRGSMRNIHDVTERCLAATRSLTPRPTDLEIEALSALTWLAVRQGRSADAKLMLEEAVTTHNPDMVGIDWRSAPASDVGLPAGLELAWGTLLFMGEQDPRAVCVLGRARDKFQRLGHGGAEMMAGMFAGFAAALLGTADQAYEWAGRCLSLARASGAAWATSWAELSWAITLTKHGDPTEAVQVLRHALDYQVSIRDQWGATWAIELLIWAMAAKITSDNLEHTTAAATATEIAYLAGGVGELRGRLGIKIAAMGSFAKESSKAIEIAKRVLGPAAYREAENEGRRLRLDDYSVHRLALGTLTIDTLRADVAKSSWYGLTHLQRQAAIMAAAGYTNAEIARSRGRASRTIDNQMSTILENLGISTRREIEAKIPLSEISKVEAARRELFKARREDSQN
ncbi:ATP-binding protein [Nocardia sp. NPDC004260]